MLTTINRELKKRLDIDLGLLLYSLEGQIRRVLRTRNSKEPRQLRILVYVKAMPPGFIGGAEISLLRVLLFFVNREHSVRLLTSQESAPVTTTDIEMRVNDCAELRDDWFDWCDIVYTQLGWSTEAAKLAIRYGKPWVHFITAVGEVPRYGSPDVIVFNSRSSFKTVGKRSIPVLIFPPIDCEQYRVTRGDAIVLVNLSEFKGARVFYELARALPDRRFIGVISSAGEQIVPDPLPANVQILPSTDDMRTVYSSARIMLMPSKEESFGRVALEAACSGIPTIGTPVEGLLEVLGSEGLFAPREDLGSWVRLIRELDDERVYMRASEYARSRPKSFDARGQMAEFEKICRGLR